MALLLEIENLHVRAGDKEVLRGVDLAVNPGEIHFIMGPNGSGKTTLAHAVMGHPSVAHQEGSIEFRGSAIVGLAPEERAKRGLYLGFQNPTEVPGVGMVSFLRAALAGRGRELPGMDEFRASLDPVAAKIRMAPSLLERNLNEGFSGGEKKRSEILQMRVLEPTLAILDEFDSGLDVDGVRAISDALNDWMNPERALIIITHTGRVSEFLNPHAVHIMKDGVIVTRGGPELVRVIEERGFESLV